MYTKRMFEKLCRWKTVLYVRATLEPEMKCLMEASVYRKNSTRAPRSTHAYHRLWVYRIYLYILLRSTGLVWGVSGGKGASTIKRQSRVFQVLKYGIRVLLMKYFGGYSIVES